MGLISGLLTLPLAPVRATMQLAELLERQAENELNDESSIRAALVELEAAREEGLLSEQELAEAENALLEKLLAIRGIGEGDAYGELW